MYIIILQRNKLSGVFTICNGHLCKSGPFDAAHFGMLTESAESAFYGNVGVTLHAPDMEDQDRDVDVVIPPDKVQVNRFGCVGMTPHAAVLGIYTEICV